MTPKGYSDQWIMKPNQDAILKFIEVDSLQDSFYFVLPNPAKCWNTLSNSKNLPKHRKLLRSWKICGRPINIWSDSEKFRRRQKKLAGTIGKSAHATKLWLNSKKFLPESKNNVRLRKISLGTKIQSKILIPILRNLVPVQTFSSEIKKKSCLTQKIWSVSDTCPVDIEILACLIKIPPDIERNEVGPSSSYYKASKNRIFLDFGKYLAPQKYLVQLRKISQDTKKTCWKSAQATKLKLDFKQFLPESKNYLNQKYSPVPGK